MLAQDVVKKMQDKSSVRSRAIKLKRKLMKLPSSRFTTWSFADLDIGKKFILFPLSDSGFESNKPLLIKLHFTVVGIHNWAYNAVEVTSGLHRYISDDSLVVKVN